MPDIESQKVVPVDVRLATGSLLLAAAVGVAGKFAGHSPVDQLPIQKILEAPLGCLPVDI